MWRKLLCGQNPESQHITGLSNTQAFTECLPCDGYSSGYKVEDRVPVSVRTLPVTSHPNLISIFFGLCKWKLRGRAGFGVELFSGSQVTSTLCKGLLFRLSSPIVTNDFSRYQDLWKKGQLLWRFAFKSIDPFFPELPSKIHLIFQWWDQVTCSFQNQSPYGKKCQALTGSKTQA